MADALAASGARKQCIDLVINLEIGDIDNHIRQHIDKLWQTAWEASDHAYRRAQPTVNRTVKFPNNNRALETFYFRMRSGRAHLNKFLHDKGISTSENCQSCNAPETIDHYLFHCTSNAIVPRLAQWCQQYNVNYTLASILNSEVVLYLIFRAHGRRI